MDILCIDLCKQVLLTFLFVGNISSDLSTHHDVFEGFTDQSTSLNTFSRQTNKVFAYFLNLDFVQDFVLLPAAMVHDVETHLLDICRVVEQFLVAAGRTFGQPVRAERVIFPCTGVHHFGRLPHRPN